MRVLVRPIGLVCLGVALLGGERLLWAQTSVADADIKRLELAIADAQQDVAALKKTTTQQRLRRCRRSSTSSPTK